MQPTYQLHESAAQQIRTDRAKVSVCIVNWNCRELLRQCLRSLRNESQGDGVEVIVVDNASTDGAAEMVAWEFPEVALLRNRENLGFARGCNQAARLASGDYLFFLNNDTIVPPRALPRLLAFAERHPDIGLVGPRLRDGSGSVQLSVRSLPTVSALMHRLTPFRMLGLFRESYRRYRGRLVEMETTREVDVVLGAAVLIPTELFQTVGGWSESYTFGGEDIDLCLRVARYGKVVYHPEVEIVHLGRQASRDHIGYVHANTLIGVTRSLRRAGSSSLGLCLYKTLMTLDLPLQALGLASRYVLSRMRGRTVQARRAWLDLVGLAYFARHGLVGFWCA